MSTLKITALAPWAGSNRLLAAEAGRRLADLAWVGVAFAGGMSEIPHIDARTLVINDLHRHMIALARIVADPQHGPKLIRRLRRLAFHPVTLAGAQERCRAREGDGFLFGADGLSDLLQWAEDYFVCAWMARNGTAGTEAEFAAGLSVRWDAAGGDSVVRWRNAIDGLRAWRKLLARATFVCEDVFDFLAKCKDRKGHGIYCDPPWPVAGDGYKHRFTEAQQRRLAGVLAGYRAARVVVRYGDHPLVRELYPVSRWQWIELKGRTQTNGASAELLLVKSPATGEAEELFT